jgi:hypothetical protein
VIARFAAIKASSCNVVELDEKEGVEEEIKLNISRKCTKVNKFLNDDTMNGQVQSQEKVGGRKKSKRHTVCW